MCAVLTEDIVRLSRIGIARELGCKSGVVITGTLMVEYEHVMCCRFCLTNGRLATTVTTSPLTRNALDSPVYPHSHSALLSDVLCLTEISRVCKKMADGLALGEIRNSQRPGRRGEKTYGKKKPNMAHTMALHFDLFGGGNENNLAHKTAQMTVVEQTPSPEPPVDVDVNGTMPEEKLPTKSRPENPIDLNPRLRGRRKATASRKVVVSTGRYPMARMAAD